MADNPKLGKKTLREQRLQAALRQNLKRRKTQARGRAAAPRPAGHEADRGGKPATIGEEKSG